MYLLMSSYYIKILMNYLLYYFRNSYRLKSFASISHINKGQWHQFLEYQIYKNISLLIVLLYRKKNVNIM